MTLIVLTIVFVAIVTWLGYLEVLRLRGRCETLEYTLATARLSDTEHVCRRLRNLEELLGDFDHPPAIAYKRAYEFVSVRESLEVLGQLFERLREDAPKLHAVVFRAELGRLTQDVEGRLQATEALLRDRVEWMGIRDQSTRADVARLKATLDTIRLRVPPKPAKKKARRRTS